MAVNEPIMRPSSEEVLLCEPQSEAGLQLEHYNSYHNQREKHGWQLSASSDPQPQYIVPTTGKCQTNDAIVNVLTFPSTLILSYYKGNVSTVGPSPNSSLYRMNQSPVDENVEAPDDAGDGDHVEGDATAELPPLHARHVKLLPLGQRLHLGN